MTQSPTALIRPTRFPLRLLLVLFLGGLLMTTNRTLLYPLLDQVSSDLRLSSTEAGSIASIYFLFLIISQSTIGSSLDRLGYKRALLVLYTVGTLGSLGSGLLARDYPSLVFFTAIQGFGLGIYWPLAHAISIHCVPERWRGLGSAIVNGGIAAGHGVGMVVAGSLFDLSGSWRLASSVVAVPSLLLIAAFAAVIPAIKPAAQNAPRAVLVSILRDRQLIGLYLAGFASLYAFWTVIVWGPTYLQSEFGLGIAGSGWLTALVTAIAIPSGLLAGALSDRWGRRRVALLMMAFTVVVLACISGTSSRLVLLISLVGYGLVGEFAWGPVRVAWWADLARLRYPQQLGLVLTLGSIISMGSSILGPIIAGGIRDSSASLQGAFNVATILAALGSLLLFFARDPDPPQTD